MNNENKFNHIKRNWYLKDGVVYSKRTGKPISFSGTTNNCRRFQKIKVNGKRCSVLIHEAVYMLFHDRPIAAGKEIHHRDGNPANNAPENLIELTHTQHMRIHQYQCDAPMRGIYLYHGAWVFQWLGDNGTRHGRSFNNLNEAMAFRAEIERPRRQELRALGLNCRKISHGVTSSQLRKISRKQNNRLWRTHI